METEQAGYPLPDDPLLAASARLAFDARPGTALRLCSVFAAQ
jgi:hypothetical protein